MAKLTLKKLLELKSCQPETNSFRKLFGNEVEVTEELCLEHAGKFNWVWVAHRLLAPDLSQSFDETVVSASRVYNAAIAALTSDYDKTINAARAEFDETVAIAFCRLYNSQPVPV